MRMSAGSVWSFASMPTISCREAVGCFDAAAKIRSVRIVLLFGVARCRPPRRSPGFEPLGVVHSLKKLSGWLTWSLAVPHRRDPHRRRPLPTSVGKPLGFHAGAGGGSSRKRSATSTRERSHKTRPRIVNGSILGRYSFATPSPTGSSAKLIPRTASSQKARDAFHKQRL
jgi:hypothetical protein